MSGFRPSGVIPACLMPFGADGEIDEATYRRHLATLAAIPRVTGIMINGHAAEVHALSFDERQRAIDVAVAEIGGHTPVVCGIYADGTADAVRQARAAAAAGVDALLAFPPNALMFGGAGRPELGTRYIADLAAATSLPLVVFQFPAWTNLQYRLDTLIRLCEDVASIVAIKDLCSDPVLHEQHIRTLHALSRPVSVLTTHSMWLAGSLQMGAAGIISGAGSVIADRQVAMFEAVRDGDRRELELLGGQMHALVQAFYGDPYVDWQARMKEVVHRFGHFPRATLRAPLQRIAAADWRRMAALFEVAGFDESTIYRYRSGRPG